MLVRNLTWLGVVIVFTLMVAWFGSDFLVMRNVNALISATRRLGGGDLSARTGMSYDQGELGDLARVFDGMAGSLEEQKAERKQAEEKLIHSHGLMQYIISHAQSAIAVHDRELKYLYVSDQYIKHYNVKEKDLIGKHHYEVFPDLPQKWRDVHERALAGDVSSKDEDPYIREDGSVDWTRWECRPWYEADGSIGGIIVYTEVITERVREKEELKKHRDRLEELVKERTASLATRTEQLSENHSALIALVEELNTTNAELAIAKEGAEEADMLKSAFLATMSHELRTPLNSIIGFTGIILQGLTGPLNEEQSKQLRMVRASARHLLHLINDVLDISKIEAGQLEIASEPFDLRESIENMVHAVTPLSEQKGLALVSEIAPGVGRITSDRRRVEQILLNLLNNAVKFTNAGRVTVKADWVSRSAIGHPRPTSGETEAPAIRIQVVDTGIGIEPEDTEKLFQPFRQVASGLTRPHDGTGLGFSICRKLVELLGGEIKGESEGTGRGSTFGFVLPVR
ncbi:MAG: ATP-binding protein [Candidatus Latescibacterota bacterium]